MDFPPNGGTHVLRSAPSSCPRGVPRDPRVPLWSRLRHRHLILSPPLGHQHPPGGHPAAPRAINPRPGGGGWDKAPCVSLCPRGGTQEAEGLCKCNPDTRGVPAVPLGVALPRTPAASPSPRVTQGAGGDVSPPQAWTCHHVTPPKKGTCPQRHRDRCQSVTKPLPFTEPPLPLLGKPGLPIHLLGKSPRSRLGGGQGGVKRHRQPFFFWRGGLGSDAGGWELGPAPGAAPDAIPARRAPAPSPPRFHNKTLPGRRERPRPLFCPPCQKKNNYNNTKNNNKKNPKRPFQAVRSQRRGQLPSGAERGRLRGLGGTGSRGGGGFGGLPAWGWLGPG